jgi:hypothetical protein
MVVCISICLLENSVYVHWVTFVLFVHYFQFEPYRVDSLFRMLSFYQIKACKSSQTLKYICEHFTPVRNYEIGRERKIQA